MLSAIDLVRVESREVARDVTVACGDSGHADAAVRAVRDLEGVRADNVSDRTFLMDKGGKIEATSKLPLKTRDEPSMPISRGREGLDGAPLSSATASSPRTVTTTGRSVSSLGGCAPRSRWG